nr:MAG TPA: hypothetical protein [Caudoviricetes sp.]
MRQWECGSVCPCAPICFFYFLPNPGACRGTYAARARQPTHPGRRVAPSMRQHRPLRALDNALQRPRS